MSRTASIRAILAAADDGGTIQASDMLALSQAGHLPNDPKLHTTMTVERALAAAGLTPLEIESALDA